MKKTLSVPEAMDLARRRHLAGALRDASKLYHLILEHQPNNTDAMTLLASIEYCIGAEESAAKRVDGTIELYENTLRQQPSNNGVLAALVNLLLARDRTPEAEAWVQQLQLPVTPLRIPAEAFEKRRKTAIEEGRPAMLITTMPKSASESIWNRLAEGLGLGQCYFSLGLFPDCCLVPSRVWFVSQGGVITKEHICATPHNLQTLKKHGITRLVAHLRDPRQAVLSWMHFVRDDVSHRLLAPLSRKIVPPSTVFDQPLEGQIDWGIENYLPHLIDFVRGWEAADADPESGISVAFQSFEQFRVEPEAYIDRVLDFYGIDKASFRPEAEAEVVHLRKGLIDEWREVFTPAQQARAWELVPDDLAERHSWRE